MDRSRRKARRRNPLAHLPLDRRQYLVNLLYTQPPHILFYAVQHPHQPLVNIGPDFASTSMVSLHEIVELCPPDLSVAHRIDLANPPFYPVWLCWAHGKQSLVDTRAELEQQPEGYACTPLGPWPTGFGEPWPWPWENGKGPFAPFPERVLYADYAPAGSYAVFARHPLIYNERAYVPGQVFLLEGRFEDNDLRDEKKVSEVSPVAMPVKHDPTGWWFIDPPRLGVAARRYEAGDVTGWFEPVVSSQDSTPTPKPEDPPQPATAAMREPDTTVRRRPGRQKGGGNYVGHEIEVMEHVTKLVKQWRITATQEDYSTKEDPSSKDICTPSIWGSIESPFPYPPGPSALYKCLKVYGRAVGQPHIVWKTFLESIPR